MKTIEIKYFNDDYPRLEKFDNGDFIDLRVDSINQWNGRDCNNDIEWNTATYNKGDIIRFGLGVAMKLPEGYEAILVPRSSTFKHWGFIQTNSQGVIDQTYCSDKDLWMVEYIATRDGEINRHDRVAQFRIQKNQPEIEFKEVDRLNGEKRGGFGSSGRR